MAITHTTAADGTFSTAGATNWNENHTVNATGLLKGSGGDVIAAVDGTDYASVGMSSALAMRLSPL